MVTFIRSITTKINAAFLRITLTRISALFFLFSFVHCFAQGILQASIFAEDQDFQTVVDHVLTAADIPERDVPWLTGPGYGNYNLKICTDIPLGKGPFPFCDTVFASGQQGPFNVTGFRRSEPEIFARATVESQMSVGPAYNNESTLVGVQVSNGVDAPKVLDLQCTRVLLYLDKMLDDTKREAIALIFLQFWFFIMSLIAVTYDSIPHTLAVLLGRSLILFWSSFAFRREWFHEDEYNTMVLGPESPCGYDLFPGYFARRFAFELPDLLLNCTAFLISLYLSLRLLKMYREQQFTSMGAPPTIQNMYKYFMATMACLQLSVFVLLTAMILWANELMSTAVSHISLYTHTELFVIIFSSALVVPWLSMGWYAITREHKVWMSIYLSLGLIFVGGWAGMFDSEVYRFSLQEWSFMSTATALSFVNMVASLILGVICYRNFGQGFSSYLHAVDALDRSNFIPEVFEKDVEKGMSKADAAAFGDQETKYYAPSLQSDGTYVPTPLHSAGAYEHPVSPPLPVYSPNRF